MEIKRQLIRLFFLSAFLLPLFNLVFFIDWDFYLSPHDLWKYFSQSFMQATLSTLIIALLGSIFCIGLVGFGQSRLRKWIVSISVLPAFAPTLFIVISFQSWVDLLKLEHAEGLVLVSLVHGLMNVGLAGSLFLYIIERGLRSQASLAYLEGASRVSILKEIFLSKKKDILVILVSFFGLCFSSFAIPLILGGSTGGTLEILAYRQISQQGDLFGAFSIMLFQWVLFFFLIRPLSDPIGGVTLSSGALPEAIGFKWASGISYFALLACLGGMFFGLEKGWVQFNELLDSGYAFLPLWINSLALSVSAGLVSLGLYLLLSFLWIDRFLHKFVISFGSVSSVLLGLGFFILEIPMLIKLGIGLSVLFFPLAYRIFGSASLTLLNKQVNVANLLGATQLQCFLNIVLPQVLPSALRLAGVVAFWTIGEYAFSSVVTGEILNLGLLAKSFMLGYRIELAIILNWIILLTGGILFLLFLWGADVCRRKLEV